MIIHPIAAPVRTAETEAVALSAPTVTKVSAPAPIAANVSPRAPTAASVATARDFTRHLTELLRDEQHALVTFLLALAECDGRRLWADLGYASLFDFLNRELGLSRSAAYHRSAAAWLVQRYPAVADALADGRICLTSVAEIGKVITPENAGEILPRFFHRSTREAKELVAEIAPSPEPAKRDIVTVLPSMTSPSSARVVTSPDVRTPLRASNTTEAPAPDSRQFVQAPGRTDIHQLLGDGTAAQPAGCSARPLDAFASVRVGRDEVQALTSDLRRIHITVSKRWLEKLETAKAALSHSIPSGSAEAVLDAALDALLAREARRKGMVEKPRPPRYEGEERLASGPASKRRSAIPASVRREVFRRDQGRCQAPLHDGAICGSSVRLQFDHVQPVALGGASTVDNVRLLCERHNQLAARAVFGDAWMDASAARGPKSGLGSGP